MYLVGPGCYSESEVTCGQCYRTSVTESQASSPAFIKEVSKHYDWSSRQYPTWTESVWKGFSARRFLVGSPGHDGMVFGVGISVLVVSLLLGWWTQSKAHIIFSQSPEEERLASSVAT